MLALWSGHVECARVLLTAGASLGVEDARRVLKSALLYGRSCARSVGMIKLIAESIEDPSEMIGGREGDAESLRDALVDTVIEMDPRIIKPFALKGKEREWMVKKGEEKETSKKRKKDRKKKKRQRCKEKEMQRRRRKRNEREK